MIMSHTQKDTLNFAVANFVKEYNRKFPLKSITEREFNIIHEFSCYLTPVSDELVFPKQLMDCGT